MPIYEYRCQTCGHIFSRRFPTLRAAEEEGAPPCPACGDRRIQRLFSAPAVVGGSASGGEGPAEETVTPPPLFGRKELEQVLKERKRAG